MKLFRDFLKDRSGATAVTFGLMLVPILGVTGLAVDYSVATNERGQVAGRSGRSRVGGRVSFHRREPAGGREPRTRVS